ncbi:MAG TPA: glycosyltransferase family 4 protein [Thermoanaerobaculia bacterium]|nr:glycosyltransferase family 4 protein [Thermoanaerobaculia bacterium]
MHCLLIHQVFVGPEDVGGSRHYELGCLLAERGHRFTVVTSTRDYITGRRRAEGFAVRPNVPAGAIRVVQAWTPGIIHRSFVLRVLAFLAFMLTSVWKGLKAREIDLVMGTSPPIFQSVSAWLVAAIRRRPFLLEVRDLWPEFAIDMGVLRSALLIKASRWLEAFLYGRADHILVNSPAYRDYLLSKGIPEKKVSVVPNGVDPTEFDPLADGSDLRRELGIPAGQFVATYCGALGMANDIPTVLRAAARLKETDPGIRILLVGDGKERPNLEAMARRDQLDNVQIVGAVPKKRVPEVLAASNVCIASLMNIRMFRTTYPNKVFDYMAAGRPVVLGIDGVIRDVVDAAKAGVFVPPGDDEALARAVAGLAADPEGAAAMGRRGREHVITHFDRRSQSVAFAEVLLGVVERGVGHASRP